MADEMTQEEAAAKLTAVTAQVVKIGTETDALKGLAADLKAALDDAIAKGNKVTPELKSAIDAVVTQVQVVDDKVADLGNLPPDATHPDVGIPHPRPN